MMSRKHYELIADVISSARSAGEWDRLVMDLGEILRGDNPRFNFKRFERACQPVPTPTPKGASGDTVCTEHYADNQGLCHRCGVMVEPDWYDAYVNG